MEIEIADISPQFTAFGAESAGGPMFDSHTTGSESRPGARPMVRKARDMSAMLVHHRALKV
jgi:hypothetical protein